ncbi:MAG: hypothetical protein JRG95_17440 [Deltaproteobacteria bacterium]|nr:hypothetical protein [Deltaproteobacteria bacterium]
MKRFATLPLAALLLLVPALPAAAGHPDRTKRVPVPAVHSSGQQILHAAVRLDELTTSLLRHARHDTRHPRRAERRALRQLKQLRRDARAFRYAAERGRRVRGLNRDFNELERSFAGASRRFRSLHPDRPLHKEFRRVARAVSRLDQELDERRLARGRHHKQARYEVADHRSRHRN